MVLVCPLPLRCARSRVCASVCACSQSGKRDVALTSWFPGNANLPGYLDGSLPGDFGFDPLYLSADPAKKAW